MGTSSIGHHQYSRAAKLTERFFQVRKKTEELCAPLAHEDHLISVTEDTSPPKWHLAHTSWFFEHFVLRKYLKDHEDFDPMFGFLFNSYYKGLGRFLPKPERNVISRPTLEDVLVYRHRITEGVRNCVEYGGDELLDVLELGINHEEQHQELLLMDIKRNFFANPLRPAYRNTGNYSHGEIGETEWRRLPEGLVQIGVPQGQREFAFDNERDVHKVWIDSFLLATHLVTNDEYLAFMDDGGYENPRLWMSDGWDLKEKEGWQAPLYWEKNGQDWWTYTLSGMVPLEYSAPVVHVSYYEAQAFARWKGARLPTEAEWETAAKTEPVQGQFLEGDGLGPDAPFEDHVNFSQIHGTVWEWTQSAYLPYPRFRELRGGLREYNGKFMCNQMVLRGGSCLTPTDHYRPTYRNFYYPHMRWMYGGIRLAKDLA